MSVIAMRSSIAWLVRPTLVALCLIVAQRGAAVNTVRTDVGNVTGAGWQASDVSVTLEFPAANTTVAHLTASRVIFPDPVGSLERVAIACTNPVIREPLFSCRGAEVSGNLGALGAQRFRADVAYDSEKASLVFTLTQVRLADGGTRVAGSWNERGWRITLEGKDAVLAKLRPLVAPWVDVPKDLTVDGKVSFRVSLQAATEIDQVDWHASFTELTANNAAGTLATDKLETESEGHATRSGEDWNVEARVSAAAGQAYSDPIFIDFGQHPLKASITARWLAATSALALERADFEQDGVARGRVSGELDFAGATLL
jgi:hypothetical protein